MQRKNHPLAACLCVLLILLSPLAALCEGRVFLPGETEPFDSDTKLLTIHVAPLRGADCMLLTMDNLSMFVDTGTTSALPYIQELIKTYGLEIVDYVYNSHPHDDHIGGFIALAETGFPIGALLTFFPHDEIGPSILQKLAMRTAEERGIPVIDLKNEDRMDFGGAELISYKVPENRVSKMMGCNDKSAMLMVRYGDCSVLLSGDVELRAQAVLAEMYDLKADILKIPHHGAGKTLDAFLDNVSPEFAFVTGGSYDTDILMKQLRKRAIYHVNFASWGPIIMQTDGTKWIVYQDQNPDMAPYIDRFLEDYPWMIP